MAHDVFYTSAILRERADLLERRPTGVQWERLAATYHGRPVRSVGIVREVESRVDEDGGHGIRITAYDEAAGEPIHYDLSAACIEALGGGAGREQFERWHKGQKVVVEGILDWIDARAAPTVAVTAVRHE